MPADSDRRATQRGRFATTRWSLVVAAGEDGGRAARDALETLCATYWYPLYAYARRRGNTPHEAQDLTQGCFARLLERGSIASADRERGRFRTFLLTAFNRHASKEAARANAQKRGGGRRVLSLDLDEGERRYGMEPVDERTPQRVFDRRWALTLLDRALDGVRDELASQGKADRFDALRVYLGGAGSTPSHAQTAAELGTSVGAVKVAVHRLRARFRGRLREEIAQTVSDPAAVDDELRHLQESLAG